RVFTRDAQPIGDFRKTWWKVCVKAGVGRMFCRRCGGSVTGSKCKCGATNLKYVGLLFHDLRRTWGRTYRRLGGGEKVIMGIGGWKTRSVFERYNIVTQADVVDAVTKLEKAERKQVEQVERHAFSHESVTVAVSTAEATINTKPF